MKKKRKPATSETHNNFTLLNKWRPSPMIKRKTKETIKEYDENGRVTRETMTETEEEDNNVYSPYQTYPPIPTSPSPWWSIEPYCTATPPSYTTTNTKGEWQNAKRDSDADA